MAQASITDFFGIRTQKRKYAPDGDHVRKKVVLERDGRVTPEEKPAIRRPPRHPRAVSKLSFEDPPTKVEAPSSVEASRKELSLGKIAKSLVNSSRLGELKAKLTQFNENYQKLKSEPQKTPEKTSLKEFRTIDLEVPASPSKCSPMKPATPLTSPIKEKSVYSRSPLKSSPSKIPAYLRYASLATSATLLPLPHHYRWLAEVFRAVETMCAMLHNRKETITFSRIKPGIQEMLKRNVTEKHLSQIKHLSPLMYSFTREAVKKFGSREEEVELVLTPRIVREATGSPVDSMNPEIILERRRSFYNLLIEQVKNHHEVFLAGLDPPMTIPKSKLTRWHPEFDLERIPGVECNLLPELPSKPKYTTAKDMLQLVSEKYTNPKILRALQRVADAKPKDLADNSKSAADEDKDSSLPSFLNPAFKNIPPALLLKIKAKQAENALKAMTCVESETSLAYRRLPELARTLQNLFAVEKKNVLSVEALATKLENSFSTKFTEADMSTHLKLLSKEAPEWLTLCNVRKTEFVKLLKNADLNKVLTKLEALVSKHSL